MDLTFVHGWIQLSEWNHCWNCFQQCGFSWISVDYMIKQAKAAKKSSTEAQASTNHVLEIRLHVVSSNIWTQMVPSKISVMVDWIQGVLKNVGRGSQKHSRRNKHKSKYTHSHAIIKIPTIHMYLLWVAVSGPAGVGLRLVIVWEGGFEWQIQFGVKTQYWDVNILLTTCVVW